MAAPSSSSCEVLDLGSLAAGGCDDATSQLFFSGGGDFSWPWAGIPFPSALTTQNSLLSLCRKHGVPREFQPVSADALGCGGVCSTPPAGSNALCIYSDVLESGLRFPMPAFYLKLLRHYRLAPSQLAPNAWRYMAAFVLRCKDAGVPPLVSAFRYFFTLYAHKHKDGRPLGTHHFQPCCAAGGRGLLFSGAVQTKQGWRTRFFFLRSPDGMPWKCRVAWGKPRREDARRVELTDAAVEKLKLLPCVDLKSFLSRRDPPVGALTLLQPKLRSTVKPESAAGALAANSLHATLEAGARAGSAAAGEGDHHSTPRKRRCPGPAPAAVTPQSFAISAAAPPSLQGMGISPGSSRISQPPWILTGDSEAMFGTAQLFF